MNNHNLNLTEIRNKLEILYSKYAVDDYFIELLIIEDDKVRLQYKDGEVKKAPSVKSEIGAQCRAYSKGKQAVTFCTVHAADDLEQVLLECIEICSSSNAASNICLLTDDDMEEFIEYKERNEYVTDVPYAQKNAILKEYSRLESFKDIAFSNDLSYTEIRQGFIYSNSKGVFKTYNKNNNTLFQTIYATREEKVKKHLNRICFFDYQYFTNPDVMKQFVERGRQKVIELLDGDSKLPENIEFDYIAVDYSLLGMIVHEALGHALEGDYIIKRASNLYKDEYINKKIIDKRLSIVANPKLESCGQLIVDADGVSGSETYLIKDGILKEFLNNRQSAYMLKQQLNGHSQAESYYKPPQVRMTNIFLLPDEWKSDIAINTYDAENIKEILIKQGLLKEDNAIIYLFDWIGGITDWRKLTFDITVPFAYYFKKNEETKLYSQVSFSGSSLQLLNNYIDAFGRLMIDTVGFCKKKKDVVKTSDGGPELTVFRSSPNITIR